LLCPYVSIAPPRTISKSELKGRSRRRGSQGRVFATGNEGEHRAHSGNEHLQ
jgi:hypothetical protein